MKIELIKETDELGTVMYSIDIDGKYLMGSSSPSYERVKIIYEAKIAGKIPKKEVLESEEI